MTNSSESDDRPTDPTLRSSEIASEASRFTGVSSSEDPGGRTLDPASEGPPELGDDLPSSGLLSFYDRLRNRITRTVSRRGGSLSEGTVEALLLVPDVFVLLLRLLLDRETPSETRALIGGALAYFVLPADLLPEAFVGVGGFLDDLVLSSVVLSSVLSPELEERARRYWSGSQEVRRTLTDVVQSADALLGADLVGRLEKLLAKRGIDMEPGS
ncbi:MAG: DUF1232 domain-containing protein [Thermoanaerobaculia bacterium]|nr:DUF1232 domain-containing protein [Thermoanaerobaculia bacterium]